MQSTESNPAAPPRLPDAVVRLVEQLESEQIAVWQQGDRLLEDLLNPLPIAEGSTRSAPCLLCAASADSVANLLPAAVVTAAHARRFSLATDSGPVDLIPLGPRGIDSALLGFGLSVWAVAFRVSEQVWADPSQQLPGILERRLELLPEASGTNPFARAPRRYWLAARLLAEHGLTPSLEVVEAARLAVDESLAQIPQGATARRELTRILMAREPARGLGFLRQVGLADAFFPKNNPSAEEIIEQLPARPGLRWAAWISGSPCQASLRRWKMPPVLAREIERLLRIHPIDRTTTALAEAGLRRLWQRLDREELEILLHWRRLELDRMPASEETERAADQLERIATRFEEFEGRSSKAAQVEQLGLDGAAIMKILGCGPGREVGEALRHLALFSAAHPEANEPSRLEAELRTWFAERKADSSHSIDPNGRKIG